MSDHFVFVPAVRERVHLLIGLSGGSGSGKTFSAMRLATGLARGERFAVIDSEKGRAKHYAGPQFGFKFDHCDLSPPFRPERYTGAIHAAEEAGYPVIVVDCVSHEWYGEGGVLEWADAELERMGGRDSVKMASWIKPKLSHKRFVQKLLQVNAHLILLFRAEPKIEMGKDDRGKTVVVPKESLIGYKGWIPVTEKNMPFELTASFMLTPDAPGIPHPIKLQQQHRPFVKLDALLDESVGTALAEWADGGEPPEVVAAKRGMNALESWWSAQSKARKLEMKEAMVALKETAAKVDAERAAMPPPDTMDDQHPVDADAQPE